MRRALAATAAAGLLLVGSSPAQALTPPPWCDEAVWSGGGWLCVGGTDTEPTTPGHRVAGVDRYQTSVALSQAFTRRGAIGAVVARSGSQTVRPVSRARSKGFSSALPVREARTSRVDLYERRRIFWTTPLTFQPLSPLCPCVLRAIKSTLLLRAKSMTLPAGWVAIEAVRSWPSLGGPWALLGTSQWNQPGLLASAAGHSTAAQDDHLGLVL